MDSVAVAEALRALLTVLPEEMNAADLTGINAKRRKQLRDLIGETVLRLEAVAAGLDPVQMPRFVFDPSNPDVVGRLIGATMLEQPRVPLASIPRFYGSGVYALYYQGDFPAYVPIKGTDTPIYVGKADPAKLDASTSLEQGEKLYGRLYGDHARSIRHAEDHARATKMEQFIRLADFDCRYLVVRSAWQNTAEDYLIDMFNPIWNDKTRICYGFGKHGDAPTTRANSRSPWDTLHPGRPWATSEANLPNTLSPVQIIDRILKHYTKYPPKPR